MCFSDSWFFVTLNCSLTTLGVWTQMIMLAIFFTWVLEQEFFYLCQKKEAVSLLGRSSFLFLCEKEAGEPKANICKKKNHISSVPDPSEMKKSLQRNGLALGWLRVPWYMCLQGLLTRALVSLSHLLVATQMTLSSLRRDLHVATHHYWKMANQAAEV